MSTVSGNSASPSTVWVVSFVYWNGDEQGGGGFWWYPDHDDALLAFEEEKQAWKGTPSRVRLVRVDVPSEAWTCEGHDVTVAGDGATRIEHRACDYDSPLTCWLDSNIDGIERIWPAEKVWIDAC